MKINIIPSLLALIAAALCAFLFYTMSDAGDQMLKALAISGFISIGVCLECGVGISFNDSHHTSNSVAISIVFAVLFIIEHCCFATWGNDTSWLIITTGLLMTLYLLIIYGISNAKA